MKFRSLFFSIVALLLFTGCTTQTTKPLLTSGSTDISRALLQQHKVWQGTPYKLGGHDMKGVDCSAFTKITYRQLFSIHLPRTTAGQAYYGERIKPAHLTPGDLVLFRTDGEKQRHVGIYVEDGIFLHASTSKGVTLSRLNNPYWKEHYWKAIRPQQMQIIQKQY